MNDLRNRLLFECRRIAESTMWNSPHPESIDDIVDSDEREAVAQAYYKAAIEQLNYIGDRRDPEILLRAVRYLSVHAMPPLRDSVAWFREGLRTLLVIACPFTGTPPGGEPFFADIRQGMVEAEKDEVGHGSGTAD